MVAHEKRNSAQLFCAVPTRNDLALSSLLFPAQPTQKLGYPICAAACGMRTCRGWWMPTAWTYTAEGDDLCSCSIFTVPVLDAKKAIDHYTVYGGTLLIRNDADGRSYLYDLLDVQKKKVISKTSFSAETHSEVTSPKPSANSIPTGGGNVNSNNLSGRKAAQLATIERSNPFDPELGAHTWIRSAEDILTVQEGHRQLRRRG